MHRQMYSVSAVTVVIAASVRSPDIVALAKARGWNAGRLLVVRVNAGVDVANLVIPASIPSGRLTLVNNGRLGGMNDGSYPLASGLIALTRIAVDNRGQIFSAGARGGSGGDGYFQWEANTPRVIASGGGGGVGAGFSASGALVLAAATSGYDGTYQVYDGDVFGGQVRGWAQGGKGGVGGDIGGGGGWGQGSTFFKGSALEASSSGGIPTPPAANPAVQGNSLITWINLGTITGPRA